MESYRKIAIGEDLKNAMFYVVGGKIKGFEISDIILVDEDVTVYIQKDEEKQRWRTFPLSIISMREDFIIE
jgi:predicted RNA-binding protein with PUA domain